MNVQLELVRHTRTDTPPGLCYGRSDVPLADTFATEALQAIERLRQSSGPPPALILASPLTRSRRLAEEIAAALAGPQNAAIELAFDERLQELDFGEWEGRSWDEIDAADRERSRQWMESFVHTRCPGGESYAELAGRVTAGVAARLKQMAGKPESQRLLVVCHAGPIRALLAHALGMALEHSFRLRVDHGTVSTLRLRWPEAGAAQVESADQPFGCSSVELLELNRS